MQGKTEATTHDQYIAEIDDPKRQADVRLLHELIRRVAPELEPTMRFGMLGYGEYHYKYKSGREGDWMKIGIANNKRYISLYCCAADADGYVAEGFRDRLPKADIGRSCVRMKRVSDLDMEVLEELVRKTSVCEASQ